MPLVLGQARWASAVPLSAHVLQPGHLGQQLLGNWRLREVPPDAPLLTLIHLAVLVYLLRYSSSAASVVKAREPPGQ